MQQQVPLLLVQEVDEQGNIVDVPPPIWDHPSLYIWLRTHEPDLFRQIFGEPRIFTEQPVHHWPPFF